MCNQTSGGGNTKWALQSSSIAHFWLYKVTFHLENLNSAIPQWSGYPGNGAFNLQGASNHRELLITWHARLWICDSTTAKWWLLPESGSSRTFKDKGRRLPQHKRAKFGLRPVSEIRKNRSLESKTGSIHKWVWHGGRSGWQWGRMSFV